MTGASKPKPVAIVEMAKQYGIPKSLAPVDLFLHANEGRGPAPETMCRLGDLLPSVAALYQKPEKLEALLATREGFEPEQVIVTTGGDDGIDRICRAFLEPGRRMLVPTPTFEMFPAFGALTGATVELVTWPKEAFPRADLLARLGDEVAVIVVISPNNPTGLCASVDDLRALSAAAPQAVVILDMAYIEFADELEIKRVAASLPNVLCVRTLSKAWGLAGLRVGYITGSAELIGYLRRVGGPYPSSSLSLALAQIVLSEGEAHKRAYVERVTSERPVLTALLRELGLDAYDSQTNFAFAEFADPKWLADAMAGFGIAIRPLRRSGDFAGGVRITCPGDAADYARLERGLRSVLAPQALLFDMDGVLVDVRQSYRQAIMQTCAHFGVVVSDAQISQAKTEPGSNNDWVVSQRLITRGGGQATLAEATAVFESLYHGAPDKPGLHERETLLPRREILRRFSEKIPLGIVTGRPRLDAERFLERAQIREFFKVVVTMEDAPAKPDPAPVKAAMNALGVSCAWMIGDAPDDIAAARAAGVLPIGGVFIGENSDELALTLQKAGAGLILTDYRTLEGWINVITT
jgi:histidinol-phosphate aminotransferase